MEIMPYRARHLEESLAGLERSDTALVAWDGAAYGPAGFTDDPGIYYFIPKLAQITGLSTIAATELFFSGMLLAACLSAIVPIFRLVQPWWARAWAVLLTAVFCFVARGFGDVYVIPAALVAGLGPWLLLLVRAQRLSWPAYTYCALFGLLVGMAHLCRHHAGTPLVILLLATLPFAKAIPQKQRLIALALVAAGLLLPIAGFQVMLAQRDAFLRAEDPAYVPVLTAHPLWHSVYIGIGFLGNPDGIVYLDEVATRRVAELSPDAAYLSTEYEDTLRREVFRLIKRSPFFFLRLATAKTGVLVGLFLLWANLGLVAIVRRPPPLPLLLGYAAAMAFAALPGLLVMPLAKYLLGFVGLSAMVGLSFAPAKEHPKTA